MKGTYILGKLMMMVIGNGSTQADQDDQSRKQLGDFL